MFNCNYIKCARSVTLFIEELLLLCSSTVIGTSAISTSARCSGISERRLAVEDNSGPVSTSAVWDVRCDVTEVDPVDSDIDDNSGPFSSSAGRDVT